MILPAFLFALVLVVGATAYAAVQGVSLWRDAKRTGKRLSDELSSFEERAARTERLLAEFDRSGQALREAQERLHISLARLHVLTEALERSRQRTRWIRAFVPYV